MTSNTTTIVNFHGSNIIAIAGDNPETTYVALKPVIENIGLVWRPQHKKITEHPILSPTVTVKVMVAEDGKEREMSCLPLDMLNFWLATIHPDRIKPLVGVALRLTINAFISIFISNRTQKRFSHPKVMRFFYAYIISYVGWRGANTIPARGISPRAAFEALFDTRRQLITGV